MTTKTPKHCPESCRHRTQCFHTVSDEQSVQYCKQRAHDMCQQIVGYDADVSDMPGAMNVSPVAGTKPQLAHEAAF